MLYCCNLYKMNTTTMQENRPTAINTDVAIPVDSLNFGNPVFIPRDEADAFLRAPKTPERPTREPICPGAPARPSK